MHRWKSSLLLGLLLIVAAAVGGSGRAAHAATTRVWTGAVNLNWNTAGNWSPAGVPVDGDSVVIGAAANGKTLNNDRPSDLALNSLSISVSMTIVGNRLGIVSIISASAPFGDVFLDLPIALNGDVDVSIGAANRLFMRERDSPDGTIALALNGHRLSKTGGRDMEFSGEITGSGEVRDVSGDLRLNVSSFFSGTISAQSGARILLSNDIFRQSPNCAKAPNAKIVLTSAELSVICAGSIGSLSGSGTLAMPYAQSRLTIAGASGGAVFTGNVTGAAPSNITCCSAGSQTFRGSSTYSGYFTVSGGILALDGATFPSASLFTVQGKGAFPAGLGGYGTFGTTVLITALLDLTSVNGKFGLARFPQLLLAPDVEVDYEIKGATPGTGFTQVVTTDKVDIDSARLSLDFGSYVPAAGQSFTLIKGFTTGTFRNVADDKPLAEGAVFTASGMQFKISYNGAADDVVITRQGGAATPTPSPSPTSTPSPQMKYRDFIPMVARES